jgi:hypothetical protein
MLSEPHPGIVNVFFYGLLAIGVVLVGLALMTIAQVAGFLIVQRKQSRPGERHPVCPTCGYDLRASRFRCSECGTQIRLLPPDLPRVTISRGFVIMSSRRGRDS